MSFQSLVKNIKSRITRLIFGASLTRVQLNDWLKTIHVNSGKVLEVGASLNPVIEKVKTWKVKEYRTLDNNLETECNPDFLIDLNKLHWSDINGWTSEKIDKKIIKEVIQYTPNIVFCLEVMEYIYKPETVLKFFYDVLAPKGILYISFHSIYPVHQPYEYDSLRYTMWGIIHLLEEVGFTKWEIAPRVANKGREELKLFFKKEKMHYTKNSDKIFDIGSFVKAYK